MTVQQLALRLLKYIGVISLDPVDGGNQRNTPGLITGDLDDVAMVINSALQDIFAEGPRYLSQRPHADILRPPTQITLTVTQYSSEVAIPGFEPWMRGCTISLPGDPSHNEIVNDTALVRPHPGASGSVQGTLWSDAIVLPPEVRTVLEPVEIPHRPYLTPVSGLQEFRTFNNPYLRRRPATYTNYQTSNKQPGCPVVYFTEAVYQERDPVHVIIRFNPMPDNAYPVKLNASVKPPQVTAADIVAPDDDTFADPLVKVPTDWHESILFPIALQRFSAHPAFQPQGNPAEIARQHEVALNRLKDLQPQVARTRAFYR